MNMSERLENIEKVLHKVDRLSHGKYDNRPSYDQQREAERKLEDLWEMNDLNFLLKVAKDSLYPSKYKAFYDYFSELYGTGLEVANWHLNGDLEPFDEFFEAAEHEMNKTDE